MSWNFGLYEFDVRPMRGPTTRITLILAILLDCARRAVRVSGVVACRWGLASREGAGDV